MLATIVYAINPNQDTPVEGFTAFSPTAEAALKRKAILEHDIAANTHVHWNGEWRKSFVDRCKNNGWQIHVKNCMIA